jgi:hypothetical protein
VAAGETGTLMCVTIGRNAEEQNRIETGDQLYKGEEIFLVVSETAKVVKAGTAGE